MDEFILSVARYLEANDSLLTPVRKRPLYPNLDATPTEPPPAFSSDYANFTTFSVDPSAPPSSFAPQVTNRYQTRSSVDSSPPPQHVTHIINNHYHTRSESPFYRQPVVIYPPATVVVQEQPQSREQKKEENKQDQKEGEASPWLGAAILATGTVATTIAVSKLALSRKQLAELIEQRKTIRMALISDDEETFINQFDATFAELKKSSNIMTGSALSGGSSALLFGSLLFVGSSSEVASAVAVVSGCGALAAACYAYFFVSDDRNTRCKKLHALAKKIIEKDV